MNEFRLVMCDVGGVLIDHEEERHYRYLAAALGVPPEKLIPIGSKFARLLERREITMKEVEESLSRTFGISQSKTRGSWARTFRKSVKVREIVKDLLQKLAAEGVKIAITTNTNLSDYRSLYGKDGLLKELRKYRIFASCFMGVAKPDPEYYKYVLKSMNAVPEETLFVDDKLEYLKPAGELGITTIPFKDYGGLVKDLSKLGFKLDY